MNRQLPKVNIDGVLFYIDVKTEELRQVDNSGNRISFNVFRQQGDGYTFLYDLDRKNAPKNKREAIDHMDTLRWVTLPALMELDPEGLALKYDIPLEVLCPAGQCITPQMVTASLKAVQKTGGHN